MTDKAVLNKIRKCLALARSGNEHEAAAALAKARDLMAAHGVTDAQLSMADIEEASARASGNVRPPRWESILASTVCRALGVVQYLNEGNRTFVGRGASAEIATYAFSFLFRRVKAVRAEYIRTRLRRCRPGRKRARADVFCEAWAVGVYSKVARLSPLPPDETLRQYLHEQHPTLVCVESRAGDAKGRGADDDFWRGVMAGRAVDLNAGVGAGSPLTQGMLT